MKREGKQMVELLRAGNLGMSCIDALPCGPLTILMTEMLGLQGPCLDPSNIGTWN